MVHVSCDEATVGERAGLLGAQGLCSAALCTNFLKLKSLCPPLSTDSYLAGCFAVRPMFVEKHCDQTERHHKYHHYQVRYTQVGDENVRGFRVKRFVFPYDSNDSNVEKKRH